MDQSDLCRYHSLEPSECVFGKSGLKQTIWLSCFSLSPLMPPEITSDIPDHELETPLKDYLTTSTIGINGSFSKEELVIIPTLSSPFISPSSFTQTSGSQLGNPPEPPGGLLSPSLRAADSGGLGWGLQIWYPCKFPGDADVAGPGTALWEPLC